MTRISFVRLLLQGWIFSSHVLLAQPIKSDTSFVEAAIVDARQLYFSTVKAQSNLYNGAYYLEYNQREEEHPYFLNDDWTMGSITYDNNHYEDVPLLYDISQQKIVTEHLSTASKIALVSQKVQRFVIFDHT